jgi:hypothetical protein
MAGPNCQAGLGKDGAARSLGEQWLLKKGEGKEVSTGAVVPGRGGAVLERRNLRAGLPFWLIHKMATLLFYQLGMIWESDPSLFCQPSQPPRPIIFDPVYFPGPSI